MEIAINSFTLSGYGDRMLDLLCMISYARIKGKTLYIRWQDFPGMEDYNDIPSWRFEDTKLSNFLNFFNLPTGVTLDYPLVQSAGYVENNYLGGMYSPRKFYDWIITRENPQLSRDLWDKTVNEVRSELRFKVSDYVPETPYVVIHLRRTDKLRGVCGTQIVQAELQDLNEKTKEAIVKSIELGYTDFYIATDDPSSKEEYIEFLHQHGCTVITPPNVHSLLSSYYDTWMMKSSSLIIASMRYSTFSLFPALWWEIPLWTVFPDSQHFEHLFNLSTSIQYYKNVQLGN